MVDGGSDPCIFQSVMLNPDFVIRVIPPTVTMTATAPAVPNSQAATALLDPSLLEIDWASFPAASAAAEEEEDVEAAEIWLCTPAVGGAKLEACRLVDILLVPET